jgi:hypothetical protein
MFCGAGVKFRPVVPMHGSAGRKQHGDLPRILASFLSFIYLNDGVPPFWIVFTDRPASRGGWSRIRSRSSIGTRKYRSISSMCDRLIRRGTRVKTPGTEKNSWRRVRGRLGTPAVRGQALGLCQELFVADGARSDEEEAVLQNLRELLG